MSEMKTLKGIPVSAGFVIGKAFVLHRDDDFAVAMHLVEPDQVPSEIARFEDALTRTRAEILGIRKKLAEQIGREHSDIFNAHLLILEDRTLIEDVLALIKDKKVNAEYAFSNVIQKYFKAFSQMNDEYLKERIADIKDIGKRVLQNLYGEEKGTLEHLQENVIIVAHDLSPSDTAMLDKGKILGFVTEIGGPTSHTAILGRSLEIPAVVGVDKSTLEVETGDTVIIDGTHGLLIIHPDAEAKKDFTVQEKRYSEITHALDELRDLPAETKDKKRIALTANIEFHDEIPSVLSHGAEGIGLYRTEYFYMNRMDLPSEEEQYQAYSQVAKKMGDRSVIIRSLDLGGDKFASSLDVPQEMNPFLGWRAIRFCLTRQDIFKKQLRAVLRASAHGSLRLMYPMISNVHEIRQANQILNDCREELRKEGMAFDEKMEVGAMIEIPSAALISDVLAKEVDFFSIGTNDLIQYSLAVDRANEKIAYLYEPTHPAILRLINTVVQNGHAMKKWVGVCGEMAADPWAAILLIGLDIDEISTSPVVLPLVKRAIREVTYDKAREIARKTLEFESAEQVTAYMNQQLSPIVPRLID